MGAKKRVMEVVPESPINVFFGLSYAKWLVLPRVILESMPYDWQVEFVKKLQEMGGEFDWLPKDLDLYVTARCKGKLTKLPEHLCNYRHPDMDTIDSLRRKETP